MSFAAVKRGPAESVFPAAETDLLFPDLRCLGSQRSNGYLFAMTPNEDDYAPRTQALDESSEYRNSRLFVQLRERERITSRSRFVGL